MNIEIYTVTYRLFSHDAVQTRVFSTKEEAKTFAVEMLSRIDSITEGPEPFYSLIEQTCRPTNTSLRARYFEVAEFGDTGPVCNDLFVTMCKH